MITLKPTQTRETGYSIHELYEIQKNDINIKIFLTRNNKNYAVTGIDGSVGFSRTPNSKIEVKIHNLDGGYGDPVTKVGVNWSAMGTQSADFTKKFAELLLEASDICKDAQEQLLQA